MHHLTSVQLLFPRCCAYTATIGSDLEKTSLSWRLAQEIRSSTREEGVALPGSAGIALAVGPTGYGTAISTATFVHVQGSKGVALIKGGALYLELIRTIWNVTSRGS